MATLVKKTRPAPWTQMKRGLKPRTQPKKEPRRRVQPISRARARQLGSYIRKATRFLSGYPKCKRCSHKATDIHHMRGRVGSLLNDERYWVTLCRGCHDWVHANPELASDAGLLDLMRWGQP